MNKSEEFWAESMKNGLHFLDEAGYFKRFEFAEAYKDHCVNAISEEFKSRFKELKLKLTKAKETDNIYDSLTGARLLEVGSIIDKLIKKDQ